MLQMFMVRASCLDWATVQPLQPLLKVHQEGWKDFQSMSEARLRVLRNLLVRRPLYSAEDVPLVQAFSCKQHALHIKVDSMFCTGIFGCLGQLQLCMCRGGLLAENNPVTVAAAEAMSTLQSTFARDSNACWEFPCATLADCLGKQRSGK